MTSSNKNKFLLNSARLFILATAFVLIANLKTDLRDTRDKQNKIVSSDPIYLPEVQYVRLVTFGFDNFVSDLLWFNTISYFGEHFVTDQDFRWFSFMCDLVTELDPRKIEQFEFCATLTSWIAKEPSQSVKLLSKAILAHPNHWRFRYLRGFNNWYFLGQKNKAKEDFQIAATLPGAPQTFLASLASRLMISEEDDPDTAIFFLKDMIKNTKDQTAKQALEEQYKRALMSKQVRVIKRAILVYEKRLSKKVATIKELQESGILIGVPTDPFGGKYYLDEKTGKIQSTSKKKPLEFHGRTAETGLVKKEFKPGTYK